MVKAQNAPINDKDVENINIDSNPDKLFSNFMQSQTCHQTFSTFLELCQAINLQYPPSPASSSSYTSDYDHIAFYPNFKKKLSSWKAQSLWSKLDKRFYGKEFFKPKQYKSAGQSQRAGADTKVLIIGAGPCGLRTAIDMACLGTKVVVLEKRENFSRNNVLHLWPFIITDLKALGAKKLYGRFCAGAIDHISIRQLQLILLKFALMLGVEIIFNVSFNNLVPPPSSSLEGEDVVEGWAADVEPSNHPISKFSFDVVVGADGKRNTLRGFKRKEFRGKLAIGLTVNFINRNTTAEAKVEEISGVAYIFNQEFFKGLHKETGIDLENIVYYKGETHYFVMTAKKRSLISKGVLKQDYDDTSKLLSYENVDRDAMLSYAKEAADFSTHHQLPTLDFAINHFGEPDVALFDFTCMYAAENAALFREENGYKLLSCLVGDSLLEPFWPMGTGCARGFLAGFDTVWATRQWSLKNMDFSNADNSVELQVLAERESIYRLLHQTTPQNTMKNMAAYTIDPNTRYVNLNTKVVTPRQVRIYYLSDRPMPDTINSPNGKDLIIENKEVKNQKKSLMKGSLKRNVSMIRSSKLLSWSRRMTEGYEGVRIADMSSSWRSGLAICALIHRFRPDLINWSELNQEDVEANNQLAFDVAEKQLGISPVMTGKEMASNEKVDKLLMVTYISQFYEIFKLETPTGVPQTPKQSEPNHENEDAPKSPTGVNLSNPVGLLTRLSQHLKKRSYSVHGKNEEQSKKKKHASYKKKEDTILPKPSLTVLHEHSEDSKHKKSGNVMQVGETTVKLRDKNPDAGQSNNRPKVSDRISALSNQLISQWEQNAPQASPKTARRPNDAAILSVPSSNSDMCYFCERRVYIVERLSAEGRFFHRHCFVCFHCGLTLRRGAYEYVRETGKFFCRASCITADQSKLCKYKKSTDNVQHSDPVQKVATSLYQTPERIEIENVRFSKLPELQELTEEDQTRHNLTLPRGLELPVDEDELMSDSSSDDDDWEEIMKEANAKEVNDYTDSSTFGIDSSLEGYPGNLNLTLISWLSERSYGEVPSFDRSLNGENIWPSNDSPGQTESQSSTLVRRKTLQNLTSCSSFTELNGLTNGTNGREHTGTHNDNGNRDINHTRCKSKRRPSAAVDATAEFSFFNPTYEVVDGCCNAAKDKEVKPVPLPRRKKQNTTEKQEALQELNDVFENVEVNLKSRDDNVADECVFLSVSQDELLKHEQCVQSSASPSECRKYYIPKNELSLLLKLTSDAIRNDKASFPNFKEHRVLDVINNWLMGEKKRSKEAAIINTKLPEKRKDSEDRSDISLADISTDESSETTGASSSSHNTPSSSSSHNSSEKTDEPKVNTEIITSFSQKKMLVNGKIVDKSPESVADTMEKPTSTDSQTSQATLAYRDSFSSASTSSQVDDADMLAQLTSPPDPTEQSKKSTVKKPRTIFNILRNSKPNKVESNDESKDVVAELKQTNKVPVNPKAERKYDTLDRVQDYLQKTPIGPQSSSEEKKESRRLSSCSTISLSSVSTDTDADEILNFIDDDSSNESPAFDSAKNPTNFTSLDGKAESFPVRDRRIRIQPLQAPANSIMINSSRLSRDRNRVETEEEDKREKSVNDSVNESLISEYHPPLKEEDHQKPHPPFTRKLSYDSMERRMKFRLRARNRWLRQESNQKSLSRSSSVDESPENEEQAASSVSPGGVSSNMVIIETTPSVDNPLTPTAPPISRQQSHVDDSDYYFTPVANIPKSPPPDRSYSSLKKSLEFDVSGDYVSAASTPSVFSQSKTPDSNSKRELPTLPKVPYLEAISPTGSANNTLSRDKKKSIDDEMEERENRVKRRIEEKKSLQKSYSDHLLQDPSQDGLDASFTGYSPVPSRKKTSLKNRNRKTKSPVKEVNDEVKPRRRIILSPSQDLINEKSGKKLRKKDIGDKSSAQTRNGDVEKNKEKRSSRLFFGIGNRKKNKIKKEKSDDVTTLERRYPNQSDRERAMIRGERFRVATASILSPPGSFADDDPANYWAQRRRSHLASLTPEQIDAKITRRVQIAARRQAKLEAQKRLRRAQVIQRQLEEIEVKQKDLEERGVELEKLLRGDSDQRDESLYMQEWFKLVQDKNALLRYENELMIHQRELQLEDAQSRLQQELRERMAMDDKKKTSDELDEEKEILRKMLDVVEQRDGLVALLEEQRLKEKDEFVDTETLLLNKFNGFPNDDFNCSSPSRGLLGPSVV